MKLLLKLNNIVCIHYVNVYFFPFKLKTKLRANNFIATIIFLILCKIVSWMRYAQSKIHTKILHAKNYKNYYDQTILTSSKSAQTFITLFKLHFDLIFFFSLKRFLPVLFQVNSSSVSYLYVLFILLSMYTF